MLGFKDDVSSPLPIPGVSVHTCAESHAPSHLHTDNFQQIQLCSPFPKQCLTLKVGTAELWSPLLTGSQGSHEEKEDSAEKL